jgi:DNA-binding response OmpR family regulator
MMTSSKRPKIEDILIVDDEADICDLVSGILDDEGFASREAHHTATNACVAGYLATRQPP